MSISEISGMQAMDPSEMEAMRQAMFSRLDTNGDGLLDSSELAAMADQVGTTVEQILTGGDTDEDGMMSESEMKALKPKDPPPPPPGEMNGKLYSTEQETEIQNLLAAISEASDDEDAETTIKSLIEEFMDKMEVMHDSWSSGAATGLLVDTYA